jgi:inorganic triphosphatase YgiF
VELKLRPREALTLDTLWALERIGAFEVVSRRRLQLHNRYYDSPDHALDRAGGNLRWRTIAGSDHAELTFKGPSEVRGGVFRRLEVTALLPADTDPLMAEPAPEPLLLARRITTDLGPTELVLENDRRGMRLTGRDAVVELDLDITTMPGTDYYDLEIEAEMVSGDPEVLTELEAALRSAGPMKRSAKGKRARGWEYLRKRRSP